MSKIPEDELEFLTPRKIALLRTGRDKAHLVQTIILIFFIIFIFWSSQAELHEVTKAAGKIVESTHIQNINTLEGGIVREILVRENQIVQPGQLLARLDKTVAKAKYDQDIQSYYRYLATLERIQAQLHKSPHFIPSQEIVTNAPGFASQENERFQSNMKQKQTDITIAKQDFLMKKQELKETKAELEDAQEQYAYAIQQQRIIQPLANKMIYSKMDYLKLMRDLSDQRTQLYRKKASLKRLETAVQQSKKKLEQVTSRYHNEELQDFRDAQNKLMEMKANLVVDRDRIMRTDIRSPVRGTIRDLKMRTIGSTLQPAEPLLDIVPLNDTLIVEVQVSPTDIGFIHIGMDALVKVTAYDFGSYGGLDAVIEAISPDTVTDKKEQTYFRVLLRTKSNTLIKNGKFYTIMPGMQVEANILTGSKSILKYLMKPFLKAFDNAMTEK